jgi:ubiquinone/menaquinone biosynthesis C-methylase UbiE
MKTLGFDPFLSLNDVWESEDVVKRYCDGDLLLLKENEEAILKDLKEEMPSMKMLDIGVGAGRTTYYFAPLAKQYVGLDYSKKMIDFCRKRFQGYPKKIFFETGDSRDLKSFNNSCFDFVMFSNVGIDTMSHKDRLKTLREMQRVTRNGGYVCFSIYNLNFVWKFCTFHYYFAYFSKKQFNEFLKGLRRLLLIRLFNRSIWKIFRRKVEEEYVFNHFSTLEFRLKIYLITAKAQVKQLNDLGFTDIRIYGADGRKINEHRIQNSMDGELYFLCRRSNQLH